MFLRLPIRPRRRRDPRPRGGQAGLEASPEAFAEPVDPVGLARLDGKAPPPQHTCRRTAKTRLRAGLLGAGGGGAAAGGPATAEQLVRWASSARRTSVPPRPLIPHPWMSHHERRGVHHARCILAWLLAEFDDCCPVCRAPVGLVPTCRLV